MQYNNTTLTSLFFLASTAFCLSSSSLLAKNFWIFAERAFDFCSFFGGSNVDL
jgi:hypothetical protein